MFSIMITPTCKELASRVNNRIMEVSNSPALRKGIHELASPDSDPR